MLQQQIAGSKTPWIQKRWSGQERSAKMMVANLETQLISMHHRVINTKPNGDNQ